ncbi:hypothetical protein [Arthrobacter sp. SLBN-122]|uniref:hypothetical protein n=1 Tax=Arthrobacter sp. SLBN-122 TaxID=2768455 RepID=UPI00114FDE67|nr:hypothetical protein [Arthrobacter sp. SLBN-122]
MNFDFMLTEAWLQGALGGACLALGRLILTFISLDHSQPNLKYGRFILAHFVAGILFALLGAAVSWGFEGKAGNFMQGISAMAVLALLAGNMLPDHNPAPVPASTPPQGQNTGATS